MRCQFLCMLIPTLLIEGVLLYVFGYRSKKSWKRFLLVNLITQGGFAVYLAVTGAQPRCERLVAFILYSH